MSSLGLTARAMRSIVSICCQHAPPTLTRIYLRMHPPNVADLKTFLLFFTNYHHHLPSSSHKMSYKHSLPAVQNSEHAVHTCI